MSCARTAVLASALILGACTTDLRTSSLDAPSPPTKDGQLPAGFVYNLPAAVISPTASIRVADCAVDEVGKALLAPFASDSDPSPVSATFAVAGDIAVEQVPGQPVLIDYRQLADFLKTSSIGIERHPNLMLKSVNVSVEDQSPQLIANLATIAADVAIVATNPAAGLGAAAAAAALPATTNAFLLRSQLIRRATQEVSYLACKPETAKLVEKRKAARARRDAATASLEEATAALERLMRNAETGFTSDEIRLIHEYRDKVLASTATIADAREEIAGLDEALSLNLAVPEGTAVTVDRIVSQGLVLTATDDQVAAFVRKHFVTATARVTDEVSRAFKTRPCTMVPAASCAGTAETMNLVVNLRTVRLSGKAKPVPADGHPPVFASVSAAEARKGKSGFIHPSQGIVYVEPARYTFSLTQRRYPADDLNPVATLKAVDASVPQLGTYIGLPVHAGFGEKAELKATFNTDGSLATASYGKPSTAGVALSSTLASLADKALATRDSIAERKLKTWKAEAERLTAQQSIVEANAKLNPTPDPLADLHAQIAVAEANATLAEANLRVRLANAQGNGGQ